MSDAKEFCAALDDWAALMSPANSRRGDGEFAKAYGLVRGMVRKSCLLSRTIYAGEKPSKTPCPVHKGVWSGCHFGWPGSKWSDGSPMKEQQHLREWYDAGCRCAMHNGCGCTTGWQPDEHCGCGVQP